MQETKRDSGSRTDEAGRRRVTRIVAVLLLTAGLGAAGFLGAASIAGGGVQSGGTVSLRKTSLGLILVNSRGHTVYLFAKDRNGRSRCTGSCAKFWPPLLSPSKATAGSGVKTSLLSRTRRANGSLQVVYAGHPLYTFALDKRAGQTKGEGNLAFGARWYVVSVKGRAVKAPPATTTTSSTTTSTYPPPTYPYP